SLYQTSLRRPEAGDGLGARDRTGTRRACETEGFALSKLDAGAGALTARLVRKHAAGGEDDRAADSDTARLLMSLDFLGAMNRANHRMNDRCLGHLGHGAGGHDCSIPEHRDVVAQLEDFLQIV